MNNIDTKAKEIENMINQSKQFITHDYPDLGIYSKQYYKKIISKLFNDDKNYSYIYFDVDGLSLLNNTRGRSLADIALHDLLGIIKKVLPDNAVFNRIAGDEFCIILPDTDIEKAKAIEQNIHKDIGYFSTFIHGLTVTCSIKSSKKYSSVEDIEHKAEEECTLLKQIKKHGLLPKQNIGKPNVLSHLALDTFEDYDSNGNNVWNALNLLIQNAMENHLKDLRPSADYTFKDKDIKDNAFYIVSVASRLLEDKEDDVICLDFDKEDEHFFTDTGLEVVEIDPITVKQIHTLYTSNDNILETLDEETISRLHGYISALHDELIRDPHSGLFNNAYFKNYLMPEICNSPNNYAAICFSDVAIRASNTSYGHNYSDMRVRKTVHKEIIEKFIKQFSFNNDSFSFDENDIFLIDQGGGNYLSFIPQEQFSSKKEIFNMVSSMNADVDINKTNSPFLVSFSVDEEINKDSPKTLARSILRLNNSADINKSKIKELLTSGIDVSNAFKKSIFECTKYYMENIPDADNINKKRAFLKNIFTIMINEFALHNDRPINNNEINTVDKISQDNLSNENDNELEI